MGKFYDALGKSGKSIDLKVVQTVEPPRNEELVVNSKPETIPPSINLSAHARHDARIDPHLVTYLDPNSVEAEIFKILRTNILFPKKGETPRSILVTSAIPGDGKSFIAANLSISIAQGIEEHVLLIDGDLRRSTIHTRFGFEDNIPGLSDFLSKKLPLDALLKKTVVDKLTILPGGAPPPNPSELLASQLMKDLLEEVSNRYKDRYIIVDSPPPQLTAETTVLANYLDGIILVIKYGATPKDMIKGLLDKLGREKVLGVVMNGYRVPTTERYGYGRYKAYKTGYTNARKNGI